MFFQDVVLYKCKSGYTVAIEFEVLSHSRVVMGTALTAQLTVTGLSPHALFLPVRPLQSLPSQAVANKRVVGK